MGHLDGLLDLTAGDRADDRVAFCGNGLARDVGGELDVERVTLAA